VNSDNCRGLVFALFLKPRALNLCTEQCVPHSYPRQRVQCLATSPPYLKVPNVTHLTKVAERKVMDYRQLSRQDIIWNGCKSYRALLATTLKTKFQINQPTRCNSFTSSLLDVYAWLDMSWAPPRPSSGAYNCPSSFWFYCWRVAVSALLVVVWQVITCQTTANNAETTTFQW